MDDNRSAGGRLVELDAIRGLAALSVVLYHVMVSIPPLARMLQASFASVLRAGGTADVAFPLGATPIRLLFTGDEAVILFFVLSGFVLSLPYWRGRGLGYPAFAVRRIFRVYVPYLAAIIMAVVAVLLLQPTALEASPWLSRFWRDNISLPYVTAHIWMDGALDDRNLDFVTWSLIVEMHVSLLFPLLLLMLKPKPLPVLVAFLAAALAGYVGAKPAIDHLAAARVVASDMFYAFAFMVGAVTAKLWLDGRLAGWLRDRRAVWGALIAALFFYNVRMIADVTYFAWYLLVVLSAAAIILIAASDRGVAALLRKRPLPWLGRISYSLYLVHPLVLLTLAHATRRMLPLWAAVLAMPPVALALADAYNRLIERPSNALGKSLSQWLSTRGLVDHPPPHPA
ncbi:MAG: acyltransferase family protein, partial [Alphaproteobacteria bacterium]